MKISPRIRRHDYDLRNDHSDQTLLPVMSNRFKNFVTYSQLTLNGKY